MQIDQELSTDKNGALMQVQNPGITPQLEGGDSLNWTGYYKYLGGEGAPNMKYFAVNNYAYVRHPDPEQSYFGFASYYKNPWDGVISRDQMIGLICGLIADGNKKGVFKVWLHSLAWLGLFTYNTRINGRSSLKSPWKMPDFLGPSMWQMFIRGSMGKSAVVLYPLLAIFDLMLVAEIIFTNKTESNLVISPLGRLMVANDIAPTFIGKLAFKILDKEVADDKLKQYWCGWRKNCKMYHLWSKKLKYKQKDGQ